MNVALKQNTIWHSQLSNYITGLHTQQKWQFVTLCLKGDKTPQETH
jgi:hypothetical protein